MSLCGARPSWTEREFVAEVRMKLVRDVAEARTMVLMGVTFTQFPLFQGLDADVTAPDGLPA